MMYEDIDWNEMWKKAVEESRWKKRAGTPEFWDDRVDRFEEMIRRGNRAGMIMEKIEIEPDYTVLDIGAGPGTVVVPLAKVVKGMTVVEPSNGMLSRLKENASKEKLANITCINMQFPDLDAAVQHYKEWMDISEKDEEKLRSYLSENLVEEDGVLGSRHKLRTAMVWWRK